MTKCDAATTMSAAEFGEHISNKVEEIAEQVAGKIRYAVQDAAEEVQSTQKDGGEMDPPQELSSEQKKEVSLWQKNLGIDITTMDYKTDLGSSYNFVDDIRSSVKEELSGLYVRAGTLPHSSTISKLTSKIKNNLYGTGYGKVETGGRGLLGDAADEAWSLRTDALSDWKSETAEAFKTKLLENAHIVIQKQREELNALAHLVDVYQGSVKQARADLDSIAHGGLVAATEMNNSSGDGADGNEEGTGATLGMIAGATAVAGALASGNLAMALGATSGLTAFYQNAISKEGGSDDYYSFGAANWRELIQKISDATKDVENSLDDTYEAISDRANSGVEILKGRKAEKFYIIGQD